MSIGKFFKSIGQDRVRVSLRWKNRSEKRRGVIGGVKKHERAQGKNTRTQRELKG